PAANGRQRPRNSAAGSAKEDFPCSSRSWVGAFESPGWSWGCPARNSRAASASPSRTSRTWSAACARRLCPRCRPWPTPWRSPSRTSSRATPSRRPAPSGPSGRCPTPRWKTSPGPWRSTPWTSCSRRGCCPPIAARAGTSWCKSSTGPSATRTSKSGPPAAAARPAAPSADGTPWPACRQDAQYAVPFSPSCTTGATPRPAALAQHPRPQRVLFRWWPGPGGPPAPATDAPPPPPQRQSQHSRSPRHLDEKLGAYRHDVLLALPQEAARQADGPQDHEARHAGRPGQLLVLPGRPLGYVEPHRGTVKGGRGAPVHLHPARLAEGPGLLHGRHPSFAFGAGGDGDAPVHHHVLHDAVAHPVAHLVGGRVQLAQKAHLHQRFRRDADGLHVELPAGPDDLHQRAHPLKQRQILLHRAQNAALQ